MLARLGGFVAWRIVEPAPQSPPSVEIIAVISC